MKKTIAIIVSVMLCIFLMACTGEYYDMSKQEETWPDLDGNPYTTHRVVDGETYVDYDYSEVYDKLDLSQYTDWGSFGEDGLMWVEKADYTGKQFGYIDYSGKIVIPFTSEIEQAGDFKCGYAIVVYNADVMRNGTYGILDKEGNVVLEFVNHAVSNHYHSSNGNIVLSGINLMSDKYGSLKTYIFCSATNKTVEIPNGGINSEGMYYSDGWLRTYRYEFDENNDVIDIVTFYDENAEVALIVDTNSSEYYQELMYVSDFVNGEAVVTFVGLDRNWYKVNIDKSGQWANEPVQTSRDAVGNDFF